MRDKKSQNIKRYNPSFKEGLTSEIVLERKKDKLDNKTKIMVGKTYAEIFVSNLLSFFNVLLYAIAAVMIIAGKYNGLFFLAVLIPNIGIGLYQDLHARHLMNKLRVMTQPKAVVVRDGKEETISVEDIVLDDVVKLTNGNQISADGVILSGKLLVNESLLTGESENIVKNPGDTVYSGSFVVSGTAYFQATAVGKESYVEKLQNSAKKFKRAPSQILKTLRYMFRVIGGIVIVVGLFSIIVYTIQGRFNTFEDFKNIVGPLSGSLVAMIPSGLYLLTSVSLATAVIALAKRNARVQDFYSVEMLARTDVLCVDKTGTITDGSMSVYKIVPINMTELTMSQSLSNFMTISTDTNDTAKCLREYFNKPQTMRATNFLAFNSDNKYSAVTFENGLTFVLGAPDVLNLNNKNLLEGKINSYASKGYRVLVYARTTSPIFKEKVVGNLEAAGLIILRDNIRPEAVETFKWFKENGVQIKVISGDNPITVSEVAKQAGIENAEKYINLTGLSNEEVANAALKYNVFGRVTPEQKEVLVVALKNAGHTVAMTGDGVNDILALKRADCSIAMASGSEAAKNVSHIVLLDSNFHSLPSVVGQGRRVINNLQRTCSLFLCKTLFAMVISVAFLVAQMFFDGAEPYPFLTNHLYVWEIAGIGLSAFFLALEGNPVKQQGNFLGNIIRRAIPGGLLMIITTALIFGFYHLQKYHLGYFGIYNTETTTTMAVIVISLLSLIILFNVSSPLNKYRGLVFGGASLLAITALVLEGVLGSINPEYSFLLLNVKDLLPINWFIIVISFVGLASVYIIIETIIKILKNKGEGNNDKN